MSDPHATYEALFNACVDDFGHDPPWRAGEWLVACSGRIIGAVRGADALGIEAMNPAAASTIDALINTPDSGDAVDVAALRSWLRGVARLVKCTRCDGTGTEKAQCNRCDHSHEHQCGGCDGEGERFLGGVEKPACVYGFTTSAYRLLLLVNALAESGIATARALTIAAPDGLNLLVLSADGVRVGITASTLTASASWPEVTP